MATEGCNAPVRPNGIAPGAKAQALTGVGTTINLLNSKQAMDEAP
jgi:hypothetical protein